MEACAQEGFGAWSQEQHKTGEGYRTEQRELSGEAGVTASASMFPTWISGVAAAPQSHLKLS